MARIVETGVNTMFKINLNVYEKNQWRIETDSFFYSLCPGVACSFWNTDGLHPVLLKFDIIFHSITSEWIPYNLLINFRHHSKSQLTNDCRVLYLTTILLVLVLTPTTHFHPHNSLSWTVSSLINGAWEEWKPQHDLLARISHYILNVLCTI